LHGGQHAGLPSETFGVEIPAREDIWLEISIPPAYPSQFSFYEYTDRTLSVGRWYDGEREDWPPALMCRG